ncbi:MAG TPA: hypothetical protein DCY89_07485 [Gammaproteobacteria bacterium]|nr:hypothetical protein [Gammaproteobacteria bacterium]
MSGWQRALKGAGVGLVVLLGIAWFARLTPGPTDNKAPEPGPPPPPLPAWEEGRAGPSRALPEPPTQAETRDFLAGANARFDATLPDRWRLALREGRLLGPTGALALSRASALPLDHDARQQVLTAVARAIATQARRDDFVAAEALQAALLPDEAVAAGIPEAITLLGKRRARAAHDPERAARVAAAVEVATEAVAQGSPTKLTEALAALDAVQREDPEHGAIGDLTGAITLRARSAWEAALGASDWPAIDSWSVWAERHLPEAERRDLAAATRAARDRRAAPAPSAPER